MEVIGRTKVSRVGRSSEAEEASGAVRVRVGIGVVAAAVVEFLELLELLDVALNLGVVIGGDNLEPEPSSEGLVKHGAEAELTEYKDLFLTTREGGVERTGEEEAEEEEEEEGTWVLKMGL